MRYLFIFLFSLLSTPLLYVNLEAISAHKADVLTGLDTDSSSHSLRPAPSKRSHRDNSNKSRFNIAHVRPIRDDVHVSNANIKRALYPRTLEMTQSLGTGLLTAVGEEVKKQQVVHRAEEDELHAASDEARKAGDMAFWQGMNLQSRFGAYVAASHQFKESERQRLKSIELYEQSYKEELKVAQKGKQIETLGVVNWDMRHRMRERFPPLSNPRRRTPKIARTPVFRKDIRSKRPTRKKCRTEPKTRRARQKYTGTRKTKLKDTKKPPIGGNSAESSEKKTNSRSKVSNGENGAGTAPKNQRARKKGEKIVMIAKSAGA